MTTLLRDKNIQKITINGYEVTLSFANTPNDPVGVLIKNMLLSSIAENRTIDSSCSVSDN